MLDEAKTVLFCVLKKIKYKSDLTPDKTAKELKIEKKAKAQLKEEEMASPIIESSLRQNINNFKFLTGKRIHLAKNDLLDCEIGFSDKLKNVLGVLKQEKLITDFKFIPNLSDSNYCEIVLPKKFDNLYEKFGKEIIATNDRILKTQQVIGKPENDLKKNPIEQPLEKIPESNTNNIEGKTAIQKSKNNETLISIKNIRLDEKIYLLEINGGEKFISFKSKKKGEGLGKETKQFKILYQLWDFRWEFKNGKVLKGGEYASLDNLAKGSGSDSTDAAYKHIQRLNERFKKERVAIEIKGENGKWRLIINKA